MKNTFEFDAIGTKWVIDINQEISAEISAETLQKIKERVDIFDKDYSRFREDSLVTKMSRQAGIFVLPGDADKMISLYKKMYDVTEGKVTPLIGQVISDAGYDVTYSLEPKKLTPAKKWDEVMSWEEPNLVLKQAALLDFGAGGKGYLVDIVSGILEQEEIFSYCVDAGGDMRCQGQSLTIGLEDPGDTSQVIGVVQLSNRSLCGSSGNRRAWANFHHIIDPDSLTSPREILAVWVVADTTLLADLLTTALFFTSPETLLKHFTFQYFILYPDYSIQKSGGFEVKMFT